MIIAIEELAELQKELTKQLRYGKCNAEEEIADVRIVLKQLEKIFDVGKIVKIESEKLDRLENLIKEIGN